MSEISEPQYWYNLRTGVVERGQQSPAADLAGPFASEEEAANAPELLKERSRAWADDDREDDDWPER